MAFCRVFTLCRFLVGCHFIVLLWSPSLFWLHAVEGQVDCHFTEKPFTSFSTTKVGHPSPETRVTKKLQYSVHRCFPKKYFGRLEGACLLGQSFISEALEGKRFLPIPSSRSSNPVLRRYLSAMRGAEVEHQ